MLDSFIQLIRIITGSVLPKKTTKPHRLSLTGLFAHRLFHSQALSLTGSFTHRLFHSQAERRANGAQRFNEYLISFAERRIG